MKFNKAFGILIGYAFLGLSYSSYAHRPRIPANDTIIVVDPELSKAYYAQLNGDQHVYRISSQDRFLLFVSILVPDVQDQLQDLNVEIFKVSKERELIIELNGDPSKWPDYFEPFGYDAYHTGPEFKNEVSPGEYEVVVSNSRDQGKYVLAIGEQDIFDLPEIKNAMRLIPILKRDFFLSPPYKFILSPFGAGSILIMYLLAFTIGMVLRFLFGIQHRSDPRKETRRLRPNAVRIRFILAVGLLIWNVFALWNPILLFLSGYICFEAILRWSPLMKTKSNR